MPSGDEEKKPDSSIPPSSSNQDTNRCTSTGSNMDISKSSAISMRETTEDSAMTSNTQDTCEYEYEEDEDEYEYNEDDDDDDVDNDGMVVESNNKGKTTGMDLSLNDLPKPSAVVAVKRETTLREISDGGYRMWDMKKIETTMKRTIKKVVEVLGISPSAAAVLLRKFKWDEKGLLERYFGDQERILKQCGLVARCGGGDGVGGSSSSTEKGESMVDSSSTSTKTCLICFDDFPRSEMFGMACGHEFCRECWSGYMREVLSKGPRCVFASCPFPKCAEVVTEEEVGEVASDLLPKFQTYQLRSYVETSWRLRWCPGPSCELVAAASTVGLHGEGICKCGMKFCLSCGEPVHSPATCDMLSQWTEKCQDESETTNWILTNTKKCPKCKTHIEKNQGCNHMSCTQCNYHFCWMCLQDWNVHGYNANCNKFDVEKANEKSWKKDQAERELDRYLHAFTRYQAHSEAMEFAQEQLKKFTKTGSYSINKAVPTESNDDDNNDDENSGNNDDNDDDGFNQVAEEDPELATALRDSIEEERKRRRLVPTKTLAYQATGGKNVDRKTWKEAQTQIIECRRVLKYTYIVSYYLEDETKKALHEDHQAQLQHFTEQLSEQCEKPFEEIDFSQVFNLKSVVADYAKKIVELDIQYE